MFLHHFLHFFFPVTCAACGADLPADDYYRVCGNCVQRLPLIEGLFCQTCGVPLPDGGAHCYRCRKNPKRHYAIIRSAASYEDALKDLLHKFKYQNRDYLDRFFGKLLIDTTTLHPALLEADAIIPVPLHWTKKLRRGYNQSELLAVQLSRALGKPLLHTHLKKHRFTSSQASLTREKRLINLSSCFSCDNPQDLKGKTILLVDDVCTTGSTIDACAMALRQAGASAVHGLTVARD